MDGMAGVKIAVNVAMGDGETANFSRVGPVVQQYLHEPVGAEARDHPGEGGNEASGSELVEPLHDLVHALAYEGLDALRVDRHLQQVAELVLLGAGLEGREARVAEDLLHGAQYRALHSSSTAPRPLEPR
jgi:hypothetical protein